eukprot:CAMPEP_0172777948 /NCGR_PEP_ID=MMETSP1074-20121228/201660_1 /TAXON_ID=2916 /ORGANISM="Ceratium fusus, Strain PA161109" /LENGTH=268 /DNA_ID=CAMNT_0013614877 /DNA_START=87 /DNA_END=895 /DNA_ORIENTATION=+
MSGRNTRMAQWLDYRVRVTISDQRMLVGTFMAFDKFMNVVLADCEEFRKIKSKGRKDDEKEVKRVLGFVVLRGETIVTLMAEAPPPSGPKKTEKGIGFVVLRGETIVTLMAEAPPPSGPKKTEIQAGPGRGQVAGRGMPAAPLSSAPAGLAGPVRGVGGPAAIQMQPKAAGLPALGLPPGMPPGFPARPPGMPPMMPPPGMPPGMPPPGMQGCQASVGDCLGCQVEGAVLEALPGRQLAARQKTRGTRVKAKSQVSFCWHHEYDQVAS